MATTYSRIKTHSDGTGGDITLTRCCGATSPTEPDVLRVQLTLRNDYVKLNRFQAMQLAAELLRAFYDESLEEMWDYGIT